MREAEDEVRFKKLISVFGKDDLKEIIGILHRDQIRYHHEQLEKITDQVKEAVKVFEDNKEVFPRTNTQDIIDMLKRLLNQLKQDEERNPK